MATKQKSQTSAMSVRSIVQNPPAFVFKKKLPEKKKATKVRAATLDLTNQILFTTQDVIDHFQIPFNQNWFPVNASDLESVQIRQGIKNLSGHVLIPIVAQGSNIETTIYVGRSAIQISPIIKVYQQTDASATDAGTLDIPSEGIETYTINVLSNEAIKKIVEETSSTTSIPWFFQNNNPKLDAYDDFSSSIISGIDIQFIDGGILSTRTIPLYESPVITLDNVGVEVSYQNSTFDGTSATYGNATVTPLTFTLNQGDNRTYSEAITYTKEYTLSDTPQDVKVYLFGMIELVFPAMSNAYHTINSQLVDPETKFLPQYRTEILSYTETPLTLPTSS